MPTFCPLPTFQCRSRRIGGDSGAEQRRGRGEVHLVGNFQHEGFVDDDAVGVAAISDSAEHLVFAVVGEGGNPLAVLFEAGAAVFAYAVRIHQAADGGEIAFLEFLHRLAGANHSANNFVARDARINRRQRLMPLIADLVKIGVANSTVENFDLHVLRTRLATFDGVRRER